MATLYWYGGSGTWNGAANSPFSSKVPAVFTASFDGPTATLTVTAVSSGTIAIGDTVFQTSSGNFGVVTAFGTGSGGVGTYTIGSASTGTFASRNCSAVVFVGGTSSSDDVNFVSSSSINGTAYTVTCTGSINCRDLTVASGVTTSFATGSSPTFNIAGSMSLTQTTWSTTGAVTFSATTTGKTITTNGTSIASSLIFSGVGGEWTLGSALTTTSTININNGAFDTSASNFAVTGLALNSSNSNVRSITLNGSTITVSAATSTALNFATSTNLTFNAGTSQINLSGAPSGITSGGLTFNNVSFTSAAASAITITGANTFNTLSFVGRTSVGITPVTFSADQTISTLTLSAGTAAAYRTFLRSDTIGTQRTLSVGTLTAGAADYDFRDIAITGAAAPLTGTRFGDCKGNSGITFPAAKTVYWRNVGTGISWGNNIAVWSATNGGSANLTMFPLAQDTAVFPSSPTPYPSSGNTVNINANYNIGTIDMSARTANTMTLATGTTTPAIYGNWINGTGTTLTGTGILTFAGRGSQTITSAGKTFTQSIRTDSVSGQVTLQDAFVININVSNALQIYSGTFDANSYSVTLSGATYGAVSLSNSTAARTVSIGSGTWTIAGTNGWIGTTSTNLTVIGTGTISLTSASAKTFAGGGIQTYPTINQGGAGALTITGSNKFANITNTYSATGATSVLFTAGTTNIFTAFNLTGAAGAVCTLGSTTTSQATLQKSSTWFMGANSTDGGNNTGLTFTAGGGIDYLSVSYINGTVVSTVNYGGFFPFFS